MGIGISIHKEYIKPIYLQFKYHRGLSQGLSVVVWRRNVYSGVHNCVKL